MTQDDDETSRRLAAVLEELREQSRVDAAAVRSGERYRLNLLIVHGAAALLISVLFMGSKAALIGPSWLALSKLPGFPYSLGFILSLGGFVLLSGTLVGSTRSEMVGLAIVGIWYAMTGAGFAIPAAEWVGAAVIAAQRGELHVGPMPALYPAIVYMHLAVIMCVHLWTLRFRGRAGVG